MFSLRFVISTAVFVTLLLITSTIKNKTRVIEKNISSLNTKILANINDINEAQLDYHYLTSPAEIEKKLNIIGFDNYQPIKYSKIFFNISDFTQIQNKISNFKIINEEKIQKELILNSGKPSNIIDKILEGKMKKFYSEVTLLNQSYILDQDKTIRDIVGEFSSINYKINSFDLISL